VPPSESQSPNVKPSASKIGRKRRTASICCLVIGLFGFMDIASFTLRENPSLHRDPCRSCSRENRKRFRELVGWIVLACKKHSSSLGSTHGQRMPVRTSHVGQSCFELCIVQREAAAIVALMYLPVIACQEPTLAFEVHQKQVSVSTIGAEKPCRLLRIRLLVREVRVTDPPDSVLQALGDSTAYHLS
jgi:hypothetical protein